MSNLLSLQTASSQEMPVKPGLLASLTTYFARRAAIAELQRLGDRELRDIGLNRSNIRSAVNGFLFRD